MSGGVRPVEVPYELLLAAGEDGSEDASARVDALIEEVRRKEGEGRGQVHHW